MTVIAPRTSSFALRARSAPGKSRIGLWIALGWLVVILMASAVPFLIAPYNPLQQHLDDILSPPSSTFWLGTDAVGRDVLSRLIWGARPAVIGVAIALLTALTLGSLWGLVAGYVGGVVDSILMRVADVFLAFPSVVLAIALSTVLGGSLEVTMLAIGFALAPSVSRLMRAGAIVVRNRAYIEASRMFGYSLWHRMFRHVLPNAAAPVIVQVTIFAGMCLLAQTGLAFLGIGVQPPEPSWGQSLGESFRYINVNIWITLFPGIVVTATVLSLYAIGDRIIERFGAATRRV